MSCWICKEKAEWKRQKLDAARIEAKQKAVEIGETMAIVREGCLYKVIKAGEPGDNVIEFVSKYR